VHPFFANLLGHRFYEIAPNKALLQSASHKARLLQSQLHLAGNFNTVSLILAALVRPSAAVAARLAETKRSLGWPEFTPGARRPLLIGECVQAIQRRDLRLKECTAVEFLFSDSYIWVLMVFTRS
jgi:hypothetical protein